MIKVYTNEICPFAHRVIFILNETKTNYIKEYIPLSAEIARSKIFGTNASI